MGEKKRFQSGAEIFEIYVPNYRRKPLTWEQEAEKVVEQLLTEFEENLKKGLEASRRSKLRRSSHQSKKSAS